MSLEEFAEYLSDMKERLGEFQIKPFYNKETDSITCYLQDVSSYENWITPEISVILSNEDDSLVGFEIRGIKHLAREGE